MRVILSIDPGITSGIAVFDSRDQSLQWTWTLNSSEVLDYVEKIRESFGEIEAVVMEDTPVPTQSRMNKLLREVIQAWGEAFPNAALITPGEWKTSRFGKVNDSQSIPGTLHEQDAVRMGKYFMEYKYERDSESLSI